jgi:hypothetical protein
MLCMVRDMIDMLIIDIDMLCMVRDFIDMLINDMLCMVRDMEPDTALKHTNIQIHQQTNTPTYSRVQIT